MSSTVAVDEQQRVTLVYEFCFFGTFWDVGCLAVSGEQEADLFR